MEPESEFGCLRSDVVNVKAIINGDVSDISLLLNSTKILGVVLRSLLDFLFGFCSSLGLRLGTSGFGFDELLCLGFLLALDELSLSLLGISFRRFLLFFFALSAVAITFLGTVSLFIIVLCRGKPADEIGQERPQSVLRLPIKEDTVFVHTKALRMPFDEELILQQAIVIELFA